MENKDDLIKKAAKQHQKLNKLRPSILETNLAYFAILIMCLCTIPILPLLNGAFSKNTFIILSVVSLICSVPLFILGYKTSVHNSFFKIFFFLDFLCIALSIMFSVLAVTAYYQIDLKFKSAFITVLALLFLAIIDLIVLFLGKKERLLFSIISVLSLFLILIGAMLLSNNSPIAVPFLSYSLVYLFLHLSMLIYVCGGDGFYELMSFSYLLIGIIALIIALAVISGGDGCDCGGCDGCDCGSGGGRRGKQKNTELDKILDTYSKKLGKK